MDRIEISGTVEKVTVRQNVGGLSLVCRRMVRKAEGEEPTPVTAKVWVTLFPPQLDILQAQGIEKGARVLVLGTPRFRSEVTDGRSIRRAEVVAQHLFPLALATEAQDINRITLIGRVGGIETHSEGSRVTFSVATHYRQNGEEVTNWHPCVSWGEVAARTEEYLGKGCLALVEGRFHARPYQPDGSEGKTFFIPEIVAHYTRRLADPRSGSADVADEEALTFPPIEENQPSEPEAPEGTLETGPAPEEKSARSSRRAEQ